MVHDEGAYLPWGLTVPWIAATTVPGPYVIPSYKMDVLVAFTNKISTTPVRGAGRPAGVFAWRDWLTMMTAGRRRRTRTVAIALIMFATFMHLVAYSMVGRFSDIGPAPARRRWS